MCSGSFPHIAYQLAAVCIKPIHTSLSLSLSLSPWLSQPELFKPSKALEDVTSWSDSLASYTCEGSGDLEVRDGLSSGSKLSVAALKRNL